MSPLTLGSRKPRHHTSLPPRPRTSALAGALTTFPCLVCIFFSSYVSRAVRLTMKCARTFPCSRCGASRAGTKTASPWRERPRGREWGGRERAEVKPRSSRVCVCMSAWRVEQILLLWFIVTGGLTLLPPSFPFSSSLPPPLFLVALT